MAPTVACASKYVKNKPINNQFFKCAHARATVGQLQYSNEILRFETNNEFRSLLIKTVPNTRTARWHTLTSLNVISGLHCVIIVHF